MPARLPLFSLHVLEPEVAEHGVGIAPVLLDFDPRLEIDLDAEEFLQLAVVFKLPGVRGTHPYIRLGNHRKRLSIDIVGPMP